MNMRSWRGPNDVAVVVGNDAVYLGRLPAGPMMTLQGSAGIIWLEAVAGDSESLVTRVARAAAVRPEDIQEQVEGFVAQLVAQGLLVEVCNAAVRDPEPPGRSC